MTDLTRRTLGAAVAATAFAASSASAEPKPVAIESIEKDADHCTVYHLDFGEPRRYSQLLDNVRNHFAYYDFSPMACKIVIVAHSVGIKFFLSDLAGTPWAAETLDPDLAKRMDALGMYGVQVVLCRTTFEKNNIAPARARQAEWLGMVQAGIVTAASLQNKGFAYIKIG